MCIFSTFCIKFYSYYIDFPSFCIKKEPLPLGKDSLLVRSVFERTQLLQSSWQ